MANKFELRKAERKRARLRIGFQGASGSGKTYSALLLAKGLVGDWEKIVVIDTENKSSELYSHLGPFNIVELKDDFHPNRYIDAIKACEIPAIECIIIDSVSHEWDGTGGCLDIQTKLGGQWKDWAKVTPLHRKFIETLTNSPKHIIANQRSKAAYETFKDDKSGKNKVQKMGTKSAQREGFEYELTVNFTLENDSNLALTDKDRTGLFSNGVPFLIDEKTGILLREWNESGAAAVEVIEQKEGEQEILPNVNNSKATKNENLNDPKVTKNDYELFQAFLKASSISEEEATEIRLKLFPDSRGYADLTLSELNEITYQLGNIEEQAG